jgi:methionyl-tRNA synthetase
MLDQCHNCTVEYRPKRTKNKEERRKKKEERRKKVRTNYWGHGIPIMLNLA